jgi:hypothetical protein
VRRLSSLLLALAMAGVVLAAGRIWNPVVEDWTMEPPAAWRGVDGPGYTLACPLNFVSRTENAERGEHEMVVQPPGAEFTALRIFALSAEADTPPLRAFLARRLGLKDPGRGRMVRLGRLSGRGESGTLPSGNSWKAVALDTPSVGKPPLRMLVILYEQVPPAQRATFDQILGSVRLLSGGEP